jgi:hypothetical protein
MKQLNNNEIREAVRSHFGKTAGGCCGGPALEDTNACCVADAEAQHHQMITTAQKEHVAVVLRFRQM